MDHPSPEDDGTCVLVSHHDLPPTYYDLPPNFRAATDADADAAMSSGDDLGADDEMRTDDELSDPSVGWAIA
jgi:hypothetical protein